MTDNEKWERGIAVLLEEYGQLSSLMRQHLRIFTAGIKSCKTILHEIAEEAGAGRICGECRGECCHRGKNHVTVVDMLVYFSDGKELFSPLFERDICPYLDENGCLMAPEHRPYNCITFICERIEERLSPVRQERFNTTERELRSLYEGLEKLFGNSFMYGLLRSYERCLAGKQASMLRRAASPESGEGQCATPYGVVNVIQQEECNWLR